MEESPLSPALLRGLADRSYDKRKVAAAEVASLVKFLSDNNEEDKIVCVVALLARDFIKSRNANHRKGGLIGLASTAIGLSPSVQHHLAAILQPIICCFDDQEPRVCYYACESCYNIVKVARSSVLPYLNDLIEGLCKLFAHTDIDIKNGASLLDRLIKDIVTENPSSILVMPLIVLIQKHITRKKPYIRQLMMSWIEVLANIPDMHMLDYLPEYLQGLFTILSDANKDIRQSAENLLLDFMNEIRESEVVDMLPLVAIVAQLAQSKEHPIRLMSMQWIEAFVCIGGTRLITMYATLFTSTMLGIADAESDIVTASSSANSSLQSLVATTNSDIDYLPFVTTMASELQTSNIISKTCALNWLLMLHGKSPVHINKHLPLLLPQLLRTLSDADSSVVMLNIRVLAQVSVDSTVFHEIVQALTTTLASDRALLEASGALIVRKLCSLLDAQAVFPAIADCLLALQSNSSSSGSSSNAFEFASLFSYVLNIILLTAPETRGLRSSLKLPPYRRVFVSLFKSWCPNPAAVLSLCLIAEAYPLSAAVVSALTEHDVSIGVLMQLDKLVHLLESPVFVQLRMQLLDSTSKHLPDLLRTLYGILMILPQGDAYRTLSSRLLACSALNSHISGGNAPPPVSDQRGTSSANASTSISDRLGLVVSDLASGGNKSSSHGGGAGGTADLVSYFASVHAAGKNS